MPFLLAPKYIFHRGIRVLMDEPSLLESDDRPRENVRVRREWIGRRIHDLTLEKIIAVHPTRGYKWQCFCHNCDMHCAYYTPKIQLFFARDYAACRTCYGYWKIERKTKQQEGRSWFYKRLWAEKHTLYTEAFNWLETAELRALVYAEEPTPRDPDEYKGPFTVDSSVQSKWHAQYIQNVYYLFPLYNQAGKYFCPFCEKKHAHGFGCVNCKNFACVNCVRDEIHICEQGANLSRHPKPLPDSSVSAIKEIEEIALGLRPAYELSRRALELAGHKEIKREAWVQRRAEKERAEKEDEDWANTDIDEA
jgi:hypothetical protein